MPTNQDFQVAYLLVMRNGADVQPNHNYLRMLSAWKLLDRPADIEGFITEWMEMGATITN